MYLLIFMKWWLSAVRCDYAVRCRNFLAHSFEVMLWFLYPLCLFVPFLVVPHLARVAQAGNTQQPLLC